MLGTSAREREAAFADFVTTASTYLTRTAYLLCGDEDTAHDLVQEALVRTYAAWWRVRPDDARAYARRVLVNLNVDRYRRPSAVPTDVVEQVDASDAQRQVDDRDELRRLLDTLPPQQRRVVVLRYFDDLSEAQVAECLGIGVGSVKSSCSRGLAALRSRSASAQGGDRR